MMSTSKRKAPAMTIAAGLMIVAGMVQANAADAIDEQPPVPPAPPAEQYAPAGWDGAYAGVHGSYTAGKVHHSQPFRNRHITDGYKAGVFGGYNLQNGNIVYGLEGDVQGGDVDGNNAGRGFESSVDGSLRARLGYAPSDRTLVYGTGGIAAARLKAAEGGVIDSRTGIGWTAGAGAEIKITDDVFARGEYRYTDYGNQTFQTGSGTNRVKASDSRVMLGLGVRF